MRMLWRFCKNIFHKTIGKFPCSLIFFQNNFNMNAGLNIPANCSIH